MAEQITPPPPSDVTPPPQEPPAPKPKKKRRWPKVILAALVVLIMLVVLAPTIASTGPVRRMILGIANDYLNGKVEVADWSIGWTGGIKADGVKVLDDKGEIVLKASKVTTELSLLKTLMGGFKELKLGRTSVEGLDLTKAHIDENGELNYTKLVKPSEKKEPSKPMKISGDFRVSGMTGNVSAANLAQRLRINPSDIAVTLTDLNAPITNDVKLVFTVDDPAGPQSTPGTITLAGSADVFENDAFKLQSIQQKLGMSNVAVAAANPFLAAAKVALKGTANGEINVSMVGTNNAGAKGEIKIAGFEATGDALKGDVFKSNLSIPIQITRITENQDANVLKGDVKLITDFGDITAEVNASQESFARLAKSEPPGREGTIKLALHFPRSAQLLNSLHNTIKLAEGVKISGGELWVSSDIWLMKDRVVAKNVVNLEKVAGTREGRPISLAPISQTFDATFIPMPGGEGLHGEIRDIAMTFTSAFAKIDGHTGKSGTLSELNVKGGGDFDALQAQLAQFMDMGAIKLAGKWALTVDTKGDPTKADAAIRTDASFIFTNGTISGIGGLPPLTQPWMQLAVGGELFMQDKAPRMFKNALLTMKSNNPENPTVDLVARADVDLVNKIAPRFAVEKLNVQVGKAREEFAAIMPVLDRFADGQLSMTMAGGYDGKTITLSAEKPLVIKASKLAMRNDAGAIVVKDKSLDVEVAGAIDLSDEAIGARLKRLSVASGNMLNVRNQEGDFVVGLSTKTRALSGAGGLLIDADLKQLADVAKAFGDGATGERSAAGELTAGTLKGGLAFSRVAGKAVTSINGNFNVDVSLTTNQKPLADKLTITLAGAAPDDATQPIDATLDVKSSFVNVSATETRLLLAREMPDKKVAVNGLYDMVRSARLTINAPRLDALQAIANSFSAPPKALAEKSDEGELADAPLPPLEVVAGALSFAANVNRENQTTLLKDAKLEVNGLKFKRGEGYYESKDQRISLALAAAIDTENDAIKAIKLTQLGGDLDVGQIKMVKSIVVTGLGTPGMTVTGAIELAGKLGDTLGFLEALSGKKRGSVYPYNGNYNFTQELTTANNTILAKGTIKASKFVAFDSARPSDILFREDLLAITNDLGINLDAKSAQIREFTLDMQSTGALKLTLSNGKLLDWADKRRIEERIEMKIRADWPKLWAMVKPMLSPEGRKELEDLQVAGVMERSFIVNGAFPATGTDKKGRRIVLTTPQSLKFLNAYGGVSIDKFSARGLEITRLDLPVSLEKGILYLQDNTKAKGQKLPAPFASNGGQSDFGGIQFDLRHASLDDPTRIDPWITIPANKAIFKNVTLNPLLAQSTIGKYVNPGFSNAKEASGLLNLVCIECKDVPLSWFLRADESMPENKVANRAKHMAQSAGRAEFEVSIEKVTIDNPMINAITGRKINGDIRKGKIIAERGSVSSDIPIAVTQQSEFKLSGSVNLYTGTIKDFTALVPREMISEGILSKIPGIGKNLNLLPRNIAIPVKGSLENPQFDVVGAVVKSFTGGKALENPADLLNNLQDLIPKKDPPKRGK